MPVSRAGTAFDLIGPKGASVVVLIHGLGMDRRVTWGQIAPKLATEYRVLSYDLCGHGETVISDEEMTLHLLSEQLIDLMDELGIDRASLVGFSLGGMINRRVAIDHPDRVNSLVILNSPHERAQEQQAFMEEQARNSGSGGPGAVIDAALARWFTEQFHGTRPDIVREVRDLILANDHANYAATRLLLVTGVTELIRPDPPIGLPTQVVTCENDIGSTPDMSRKIAAEIAGSECETIPNLRHLGLLEKPQVFLPLIQDFLSRHL